MSAKMIIAWVGLSIVAALIVCVLVLAFVPTKIMPTYDNKPNEIRIYKTGSSNTESYLVSEKGTESEKADYASIFNEVDKLGSYSILDTLFMGVLGQSYKVQSNGSDTSKSVSTLLSDYTYLVEFSWKDKQDTKNPDGSKFTDSSASDSKLGFYRTIMGVKETNGSAEIKIYLYSVNSSTSSTTYYSYIAYANTSALYTFLSELNDNKFA